MMQIPPHATPLQVMGITLIDMLTIATAIVLGFLIMEVLTSGPDDPDGTV